MSIYIMNLFIPKLIHYNKIVIFSNEMRIDKCCNDLEVNLENLFTDPTKTFSGGRFKKQIYFSHQKLVYHDDESDYYIYYTGNEWVVRTLYQI